MSVRLYIFKNICLIYINCRFLTLADYTAYINTQDMVSKTYENTALWTKMAIHNIASSGKFSSDR